VRREHVIDPVLDAARACVFWYFGETAVLHGGDEDPCGEKGTLAERKAPPNPMATSSKATTRFR
jgi:hypothetical protein